MRSVNQVLFNCWLALLLFADENGEKYYENENGGKCVKTTRETRSVSLENS